MILIKGFQKEKRHDKGFMFLQVLISFDLSQTSDIHILDKNCQIELFTAI